MEIHPKSLAMYKEAGVDNTKGEGALEDLLYWVKKTFAFSNLKGNVELPIGYFANIISIGNGQGLALSTDGVGSKILIAQMMNKYDSIGIDCVAMNVNDIICVGATPISMLDYLAVEKPNQRLFGEIGKGLYEGAKQSGISIAGGETSQIKDMLSSYREGFGFDLVGMAVGVVAMDKVIIGQNIEEGDAVVGIESSGIHSNGLTLARKVFFERHKFNIDEHFPELESTIGEELLKPTYIYVPEVLDLLNSSLNLKALINITSDGFLNLTRVKSEVGYVIEHLPEPQPVFQLLQSLGTIADEEMYYVYNMGVGFCIVVPENEVSECIEKVRKHGKDAYKIGYAIKDVERRVDLRPRRLIGKDSSFRKY